MGRSFPTADCGGVKLLVDQSLRSTVSSEQVVPDGLRDGLKA